MLRNLAALPMLIHWGQVTHICVNNLAIIGSDHGLSPGQRQAIIWTNAGISSIKLFGTNFTDNGIGIDTFSSRKCIWKCCLENSSHFVSASMCKVDTTVVLWHAMHFVNLLHISRGNVINQSISRMGLSKHRQRRQVQVVQGSYSHCQWSFPGSKQDMSRTRWHQFGSMSWYEFVNTTMNGVWKEFCHVYPSSTHNIGKYIQDHQWPAQNVGNYSRVRHFPNYDVGRKIKVKSKLFHSGIDATISYSIG